MRDLFIVSDYCMVRICLSTPPSNKRIFLITIIIPCFNEAARLEPEPFYSFLEDTDNINLLFVDDGSKDDMILRLEAIRQQAPEGISLQVDPGKSFTRR